MVDVICQFNRARGCPDIWLNIISWCVYESVLDEIRPADWGKQIALLKVGGYYPISWGLEQNKRAEGESDLCWTEWAGTLFFLALLLGLNTISSPGPQARVCHQISWVSGLQKTDCGTSQPIPYNTLLYIHIYIYMCVCVFTFICTIGSASLKNPNTDNILMILGALQIWENNLFFSVKKHEPPFP